MTPKFRNMTLSHDQRNDRGRSSTCPIGANLQNHDQNSPGELHVAGHAQVQGQMEKVNMVSHKSTTNSLVKSGGVGNASNQEF